MKEPYERTDDTSLIQAARGLTYADILFTNAVVFNPFIGEWEQTGFAVKDGVVIGPGRFRARHRIDLKGRRVVAGLIDAHVHIESSLLSPPEFARLVSEHGATTVFADPHEIANVCGTGGIDFMLGWRGRIPIDLFIMLPSCVPATPLDMGGAALGPRDLAGYKGRDGILGLGEVMNVQGVFSEDPDMMEKIRLFPLVDGHAPLLSGKELNAYIAAGIQSDHESSGYDEAGEKLERGMFLFIREGSTEKNIPAIIPLVSWKNVSRCSFATDDRHADILERDGHIDDCIRKAVASGLEEELAIRMATLSAAERFSLNDRGALSPGRIADFCILAPGKEFLVEKTFRRGALVVPGPPASCPPLGGRFCCEAPAVQDIAVAGKGSALVIGLVPHQIITRRIVCHIDPGDIPDTRKDILKAVVCSRYRKGRVGTGLVHGFGFTSGAIAGSVSHDSHNIVAVGSRDDDLIRAIDLVIRNQGGLVVVSGKDSTVLPLGCAGLMSVQRYEEVCNSLRRLNKHTEEIGGREDSFMYLSFLALSVIPSLRITERGLFDVDRFMDVPVFSG
ncbi:MAG: adenine deaminase [Methanoregulaceae archaeon]|nr:adenine deaminase [Methanoregulaceae archaeon]